MSSTGSDEYPVDHQLFGPLGSAARKLATDIPRSAMHHHFAILHNDLFAALPEERLRNYVYWHELFLRAHWSAILNLRRHERWQAACSTTYEVENFYGFVASLRGLLEAALDAHYSLGGIAAVIAEHHERITSALRRELDDKLLSTDIENRLIHFVFARKLERSEEGLVPESHKALEPREYRNALGLPDEHREGFRRLYDKLCGYCHPTAASLDPLWSKLEDNSVTFTALDDQVAIRQLVDQHRDAITFSLSLSVTTSALLLRTMNRFPFAEIHCPGVERWNFSDIAAWKKIEELLARPQNEAQ